VTYVTAMQVISRVGSNEYYARAVGSEEYDEAIELRRLALHVQTTLPGVAQPPMPATVDDDIGGWLDAVVAADAATGERERKHAALTALISNCDGVIAAAANLDPDRLLKSLSVDLVAVMEDVEAVVNRLGGARTPQEVIAAGVGDEYNRLGALRERYDQIREAQTWTLGSDLSLAQSKFLAIRMPTAPEFATWTGSFQHGGMDTPIGLCSRVSSLIRDRGRPIRSSS
jgi:hypothetical protein